MDSLLNTRILLVEDEHFMRHLLIQALNSVGFWHIDEAENGRNALRVLETRASDIVITDIEMKPVNGFDLVRTIRAGATRLARGTPVLFLSGLSDVTTLASASRLDVQGFLVKPVSANRLREKIGEALKGDVTLRPPAFYDAMSLGGRPDTVAGTDATEATGPTAAPEPGPTKQRTPGQHDTLPVGGTPPATATVDLAGLEAGMTLLEDVNARGTLLLGKGTRLLPRHIGVLHDLRAMLDTQGFKVSLPDRR